MPSGTAILRRLADPAKPILSYCGGVLRQVLVAGVALGCLALAAGDVNEQTASKDYAGEPPQTAGL
jgi:hypothetical protein